MLAGLYVHVPFCDTKCGYCDFYSVPLQGRSTSPLIQTIIRELDRREPQVSAAIGTIFVGGGTPTVLPLADMRLLFNRLSQVAHRHGVIEFTTEANPATVDAAKIELLVQAGVNRISFGAQSFHQPELDALERLHCPDDIAPGVQLARSGGLERINLDLIFGIPGQSIGTWRESLSRAVDLGIDHISCYGLTYEPDTPLTAHLHQGLISRCDHDLEADMYLMCIEFLLAQGFEQYEISAFAKPEFECRHNLIYWNNQPYLGVGPAAASYLEGARFKNIPHIGSYMNDIQSGRDPWREVEKLTAHELAGEIAMLQLRLNRGIDIEGFEQRVGISPLEKYDALIHKHSSDGLMEVTENYIRLTDEGRLLADRVIADFLCQEGEVQSSIKLV